MWRVDVEAMDVVGSINLDMAIRALLCLDNHSNGNLVLGEGGRSKQTDRQSKTSGNGSIDLSATLMRVAGLEATCFPLSRIVWHMYIGQATCSAQ